MEADIARDELRAFLTGAAGTGDWQKRGAIEVQIAADGSMTGVRIPEYGRWMQTPMVLTDLIAQTLSLHRDDVLQELVSVSR